MSKTDIMLQIAFLGQLLLFFFAYFNLNSQISSIKQRLREIDLALTTIKVEFNAIKTDVDNNKGHIARFDEKGFNNLHNRITEVSTLHTDLDHKVRQLDASLKGFYSTWARKLGILSSKQEKEEAEESQEVIFEAPKLPNEIPIQPKKSRGWGRLRRG